MDEALEAIVVPFLRQSGFTGSLPHFRRIRPEAVDLLYIQFDKYGGGFFLEIGSASPDGFEADWGEFTAASKLRVDSLPLDNRARLPLSSDGSNERFSYDQLLYIGNRFKAQARRVVTLVQTEAEPWWRDWGPAPE